MAKKWFSAKSFAARWFAGGWWDGGISGNGPYTIEQTTLYVPGQQIENIWPVGTDRQLVFTPGSFKINITR